MRNNYALTTNILVISSRLYGPISFKVNSQSPEIFHRISAKNQTFFLSTFGSNYVE